VTHPGEHVLILSGVGHRIALDAHVVNVSPYTGLGQMPAREQLAEALIALRREGGTKVFAAEDMPPGMRPLLGRWGYKHVHTWKEPPDTGVLINLAEFARVRSPS
jgi:hypothetical protein